MGTDSIIHNTVSSRRGFLPNQTPPTDSSRNYKKFHATIITNFNRVTQTSVFVKTITPWRHTGEWRCNSTHFRRIRKNTGKKRLSAASHLSVRLSVYKEQQASQWTDYDDIWYLSIFRKSVEKIQVSLQSDKNNSYFKWRPVHIYDYISVSYSQNENVSKKVKERIKTHILCSINFFPENCAVYKTMLKNTVKPDRPHTTVKRMRFVCWMTKATDTHSEYVIFITVPRKRC